jgi:hypothetical protein
MKIKELAGYKSIPAGKKNHEPECFYAGSSVVQLTDFQPF